MARTTHEILEELARERERLARLERERDQSRERLESLQREIEATSSPTSLTLSQFTVDATPRAPVDKVKLFRTLFRGRPNIFPTRFVSRKTGKFGYAPVCTNKFQPGLCALRTGGKCGDCANQAFIGVNDRVILDHLQGRHVMGVYPLLEDETCWLLAVDFDGRAWKDDLSAFLESCRSAGVPTAIERSRSGDGAHAWFFFASPVPARVAREMGSHLITTTMERRHELSMSSYDRLFPNQDTMPRGGFGNLIALPLQYEARKQHNTVFLDEQFDPYPDQWAFLASVQRLDAATVESIAREAGRTRTVLGIRFVDVDGDETEQPWMQTPSEQLPIVFSANSLPATVTAVLAQRLFIEKAGLPSALLNRLKRVAAFQNPEFYKKQKMRLSTALTPRVISCADEIGRHLSLPRGCTSDVESALNACGVKLIVGDQRTEGVPLDLPFKGELSHVQTKAARTLLAHDTGVFVGPPGIGKTVLGTYLIAKRARNTLVLVHRKPLLDQWMAQLSMFLGIDRKSIGQIGGGKNKPNGRLDVAMIQSLVQAGKVDDRVATYGHVIVDECHHIPAVSFERVLSAAKARFVVGMTATPQRRDGHHPIVDMQIGRVRFKVELRSQAADRPMLHRLVVRETQFKATSQTADGGIQSLYHALANDATRNEHILNDVISAIDEGRSPILLTERKDHLDHLARNLDGFVRHLVVLQGGVSTRERQAAIRQLASIPEDEERLVLATGRYIGEGFDDARLDTLFLTMPISWKGTLIQYSGRLQRNHAGKTEVRIYDYVDREVPMLLHMFEKRLRTYRAIGYARGEAPLGFTDLVDERTVEYDEEALRHFDHID